MSSALKFMKNSISAPKKLKLSFKHKFQTFLECSVFFFYTEILLSRKKEKKDKTKSLCKYLLVSPEHSDIMIFINYYLLKIHDMYLAICITSG